MVFHKAKDAFSLISPKNDDENQQFLISLSPLIIYIMNLVISLHVNFKL